MGNNAQEAIDEFDEEKGNQPVLIRHYGEYWEPDVVDWRKLKSLVGTKARNGKGEPVQVSDMKGVYVLFKDYVPVYIGKADKESLGSRLKKHKLSRRTGKRWDLFSWFQIADLFGATQAGAEGRIVQATESSVIATLEALLIMVSTPKLNSRREKFKGATPLYQISKDENENNDLQEEREQVGKGIEELSKRLGKIEQLLKVSRRTARRSSLKSEN